MKKKKKRPSIFALTSFADWKYSRNRRGGSKTKQDNRPRELTMDCTVGATKTDATRRKGYGGEGWSSLYANGRNSWLWPESPSSYCRIDIAVEPARCCPVLRWSCQLVTLSRHHFADQRIDVSRRGPQQELPKQRGPKEPNDDGISEQMP